MGKEKTIRVKSRETELKQHLRSTRRELGEVRKKINKFNELQAEMEAYQGRELELIADVEAAKQKLILELGLD